MVREDKETIRIRYSAHRRRDSENSLTLHKNRAIIASMSKFLNQYIKIPSEISDKLNSLYRDRDESVRHCLGLVIVNLLKFDEVAYAANRNFYTKNRTFNYTYTNMRRAVEIAEAKGYAEIIKVGSRTAGFKKGISSILIARPRIEEFRFSETIKSELDLESLPLLTINHKPIFNKEELEEAKTRIDLQSEFVNRLDQIFGEAVTLNRDYWHKMVIDTSAIDPGRKCFDRVGLTRIFNEGEMGRWHQKGELSFQQLPPYERPKLRLNGEAVTEIDYSASHAHLLYAWEREQCPDDFYECIMRVCGCSRFVAKNTFMFAINNYDLKGLNSAINFDKGKVIKANRDKPRDEQKAILYDEIKREGLSASRIVVAIKEAHPAISRYVCSGVFANKLMLEESYIMTDVLLELMRLNIPALPIHDSVIVPAKEATTAVSVMLDAYKTYTGFYITVK